MVVHETQEAREESGFFSFSSLKSILSAVIDLIFPPRCYYCGRVDTSFCDTCGHDLLSIPIESVQSDVPPMIAILSTGHHDGFLQSGVQALKYGGQRQLGEVFAKRCINALESTNWQFDTVIPVPLHTARLKKRGYNQAKEISIHIAQLLEIQHSDDMLIRQSQTQSQVGLNQDERRANVKEAFQVRSTGLKGATVLLVDDVKTTGATMAACAEVLIASGVKAVYGITVTAAGRIQ